jgi:hypothetical protein
MQYKKTCCEIQATKLNFETLKLKQNNNMKLWEKKGNNRQK